MGHECLRVLQYKSYETKKIKTQKFIITPFSNVRLDTKSSALFHRQSTTEYHIDHCM